jgi:RNA polymerase sigma-70 factor (ECF subfamily)
MHALAFGRPISHVSLDDDLERAFEECLAESATLAFRVAYGVLRHRQDAEDVAQETMARAYRSFAKLRDRRRFRAWLVRIAWRTALNWRRRDGRRAGHELTVVGPYTGPTVEDLVLSREFQEHLWQAIGRLPDRLQLVLTLTAMQGHGVREVAALLAIPEGTVKSRLHEARKILAEKLRWLVTDTKRS